MFAVGLTINRDAAFPDSDNVTGLCDSRAGITVDKDEVCAQTRSDAPTIAEPKDVSWYRGGGCQSLAWRESTLNEQL